MSTTGHTTVRPESKQRAQTRKVRPHASTLPRMGGLSPQLLLQLQRTAGNRAVNQLLRQYSEQRAACEPESAQSRGHPTSTGAGPGGTAHLTLKSARQHDGEGDGRERPDAMQARQEAEAAQRRMGSTLLARPVPRQGGGDTGVGIVPTLQRTPEAPALSKEGETTTATERWLEVNAAYTSLIGQIGIINQKVPPSATRDDWVGKLNQLWAEVGAPGEKSDAELEKLRDELTDLKKEIAEEVKEASESWKTDVAYYQEERKDLEADDEESSKDAIKILDHQYTDTAHAVQIAGAYVTLDDLLPLEHMLNGKKHREHAKVRAERMKEGPSTGSTVTTGAGLGAVVTYQGKTLVRLGGEKFYISGTPPKGTWTPKGGTTSEFFIYKKSDPKKMYRLDWDTIKVGPKQGLKGWEHNQRGVAKVLDLKVTNHQPAGGWGRAAGSAIRIYKWGGRALFVAGLVSTALDIYYAENKKRAVVKAAGALAGGIAGAEGGAAVGGEIGSALGPVGAGIGALLGGLIGGGLGAWGGSKVTEYVYDLVADRLEEEDDWVVLTPDQVEPAQGTTGAAE